MTTRRLGSLDEFCWMDVKTHDGPGTAAFFSEVLGWRFRVDEEDRRRAAKISVDGHRIGGVSDLADPVYPPGTPAHVAFYLAVEDLDRRTEAATAHGARLVVPPFDAGDQGRMATLIDPVGAAFSLWQPYEFGGWSFPSAVPGAPYRMLLACEQPDHARHFYRETTGAAFVHTEFVIARRDPAAAPRWELVVAVTDVANAGASARRLGGRAVATFPTADGTALRLSSPEGLTVHARPLAP